ncbi:ISxcC1 transposase [Legionella brunensis]|uniref:ISxcC1 transposase n=1 Tax=Legionella brunensis TaxID=29422 RepID=A0A0W0STK8_9GAMM|nr:ISxcC1 transposase [Legionella brunensis]
MLDGIAANRGYPAKLRLDNGPEFISLVLADWAEKYGVILEFIQPGKPTQNSFIERFNRTYRNEILDFYLFRNLNEVREITWKWMKEYDQERLHESLGYISPFDYKLIKNESGNSNLGWH